MGTIQGSAAASAAAIVAGTSVSTMSTLTPAIRPPDELVPDVDRENLLQGLRGHMLAGRLTAEEFEERVDALQRARTQRDLDVVNVNLPRSG